MTNPDKIQAFFLIDLSEPSIITDSKIKNEFHNFLEKLNTHPQTSIKVECTMIGLGTATQSITTRESWPRLGCDLNRGLELVTQHCAADNTVVELFIFLQNEPHYFEASILEQLQTKANVAITLFHPEHAPIKAETIPKIVDKCHPVDYEKIDQILDDIVSQLVQATDRLMIPAPSTEPPSIADNLPDPPSAQLPVNTAETAVSETVPHPSGEVMTSPDTPNNESDKLPADPAPLADSQGIAQVWQTIDPPAEIAYHRVPHTATDHQESESGWHLLAASRRGKLHAHKGSFREDAFALDSANGWHVVVVADGGGSCSLSRAGSNIAATTAVETMKNVVIAKDITGFTTQQLAEIGQTALQQGIQAAWSALEAEAEKQQTPLKEFGTTYLAMIHYPQGPNGHLVGVLQVGDGVVAMELVDGTIKVLADPDVGESASMTLFLTSRRWEAWLDRTKMYQLPVPPRLLAAMCDGVGDDFIPYDKLLPNLFKGLKNKVITADDPEGWLLKALEYEKRGSFDDRTLALIYHLEPGKLVNRLGELTQLLDATSPDIPSDEPGELFESTSPDVPPELLEATIPSKRPTNQEA